MNSHCTQNTDRECRDNDCCLNDLRDSRKNTIPNFACYKCGNEWNILIEEKIDTTTNKVVEKNFICGRCAFPKE